MAWTQAGTGGQTSQPPPPPPPEPGYTFAWNGTTWVKTATSAPKPPPPAPAPTVKAPAPSGTQVTQGTRGTAPAPTGTPTGVTVGASSPAASPPPPPPPPATSSTGDTTTPDRRAVLDYNADARAAERNYNSVIDASLTGTPGHYDHLGNWIPATEATSTATRDAPQAAPPPTVASGYFDAVTPEAAVAQAPPSIVAPTIGTTTISPIERFNAATVGAVGPAIAGRAQAATLNLTPQDQIRARQLQLLKSLEGVEAGTGGPSLAEIQGQKATAQALADQNSLAAQSHGYGGLAARQTAGRNVARIESQANADAQMLRAKEITDARQQLLTGLEGTRGQDIGVAGKEADLTQAVNLQNAEGETRVNISNADRTAMLAKTNAELEQDAAKGNAAAQNELSRRNAELEAERKRTEAGLGVDVAKSNQDTATKVSLANAANETQTNIVGATETNKAAATNAENDLRAQIASADNATKTNLANAGFTLQGREIDDARNVNAIKQMLEAQAAILQSDQDRINNQLARDQLEEAIKKGDRDMIIGIVGGLLSAGAAVGAAAIKSDRRSKKNIELLNTYSDERGKTDKKALLASYEGGGKDEIGEMLDAVKAVKFKYKDPTQPGTAPGQRYGVIAQDLEKSPVGKSIVVEKDGSKMIDTGQAVGVLLAAMAQMRQQQKRKGA